MKKIFILVLITAVGVSISSAEQFDSSLEPSSPVNVLQLKLPKGIYNPDPVDSSFGPLHPPVAGLSFQDPVPNHNMGIASDGVYYYTVCGGQSANGRLAKYDMSGNPAGTIPCPMDFRSIVYNNADGLFYGSTYGGDVFKITDLANGTYQILFSSILQNSQSSIGISWDGQYIYDNNSGTVNIINLATGSIVSTLSGLSCGSGASGGGSSIAADPDYLYTCNTASMSLYVYDHSGNLIQTYTLLNGNYGFSLSFITGSIFTAVDGNYGTGTWYEHQIRDFIISSLRLTLTPLNPPIQIPAGGGNFNFTAFVENTTDSLVTFDAWTKAILPNGQPYGPILERRGLRLASGASITRNLREIVPGAAPPGNYTYKGYLGRLPNDIWSEDDFPFEKMAGECGFSQYLDWTVSGWDEQQSAIPDNIGISASPNPFNQRSLVSFALPNACDVKLAIYDISGREVAVLVDGFRPAGMHTAEWDASGMSSGVYFVRMAAGDYARTVKLLLVK